MKFVDLYWFLQSLGPQVLGMLLGDDEEEGPAHIASLCALLLKDLHVTSLMIFYYRKKRGGGPHKESGPKTCLSFICAFLGFS